MTKATQGISQIAQTYRGKTRHLSCLRPGASYTQVSMETKGSWSLGGGFWSPVC